MVNSVHIYSQVLTNIFDDRVNSGNFPDTLKYADITPVSKKGDTTDKTNYRPISTMLNKDNKTNISWPLIFHHFHQRPLSFC